MFRAPLPFAAGLLKQPSPIHSRILLTVILSCKGFFSHVRERKYKRRIPLTISSSYIKI
jgi:hypothetical protein